MILTAIPGCNKEDRGVSDASSEKSTLPGIEESLPGDGNLSSAKDNISTPSAFTKEEIVSAINCVKKYASGKEWFTLDKIWFDEKFSDREVRAYVTTGRGYENGIDRNDVIVLLSNLRTGDLGPEYTMESNYSYDDWMWILVRKDASLEWEIDDQGY
jgi:hypothetical protein